MCDMCVSTCDMENKQGVRDTTALVSAVGRLSHVLLLRVTALRLGSNAILGQ